MRCDFDESWMPIAVRPIKAQDFLSTQSSKSRQCNTCRNLWRSVFQRHRLGNPYLVGVDARCPGLDCRQLGFDSTLAFTPQLSALPGWSGDGWKLRRFLHNMRLRIRNGRTKVYDITEARRAMSQIPRDFPHVECVFVGWDNLGTLYAPAGDVALDSLTDLWGQVIAGHDAIFVGGGSVAKGAVLGGWIE